MDSQSSLKKQLERSRFERALEAVESMVASGVFLNSGELARLNQIITATLVDPWRQGPAICRLPSGKEATFQVLADPVNLAKEILKNGKERADSEDVVNAAADLYAQFVLTHVFTDGNRRTAVAAAYFLLRSKDLDISATNLLDLGLGDLRSDGTIENLRETLISLVKIKVQPIR